MDREAEEERHVHGDITSPGDQITIVLLYMCTKLST